MAILLYKLCAHYEKWCAALEIPDLDAYGSF